MLINFPLTKISGLEMLKSVQPEKKKKEIQLDCFNLELITINYV